MRRHSGRLRSSNGLCGEVLNQTSYPPEGYTSSSRTPSRATEPSNIMIPFDENGAFKPTTEDRELRRAAVRGAAATVSAAALGLLIQVGSTVILARLLTPADFGLVAMVTTFSLLLMSFGINGLNEVLIQREAVDRYQASNLFWLNCTAGLILGVGFAAAGSLLSHFYRNPLVAHVAVAVSPAIFVNSFSVVHLALLRRAMRFAAVAKNDIIGRATYTIVGIVLAWR